MRLMAHMRFWMRKQCCSSLRQGMLFQASLIRDQAVARSGVLSFLPSDSYFFLPYHRADVSISWALPQALAFSAILLPCGLRSGHLLIVSTIVESAHGSYPVPTFCFALL